MTSSSAPPVTAPSATGPSRWILGPSQDLLLFVATPILILPAIFVAQTGLESEDIRWLVMGFGAMGHHLPGMMRAYGDRALFHRFRTRFIVSPIILVGLCVGFALLGSQSMVLVAYGWGIWHGWMQTYGFLRIYDAKVGAVERRSARLDFAMCAAWFLGALVFSDSRIHYIQQMTFGFGLPAVQPATLAALRWITGAVLGLVTITYLVNQATRRRAGQPISPVKNLLLVTSVVWWWYANVTVTDILIGLILFEVFHDVQYLAIVWVFNRNRVDKDPQVGSFTRFVFRRSWGLIGIYLGMVFAYGGLGPAAEQVITSETGTALAVGLVTASTLLHFYFDGFIWKVRENSTRESLGLKTGAGGGNRKVSGHAFKWLILFVPVVFLWARDASEESTHLERVRQLAASTPSAAVAQFDLGVALARAGDPDRAVAAFERSLRIHPGDDKARTSLAVAQMEAAIAALLRGGEDERATALMRKAAPVVPSLVEMVHDNGYQHWRQGATQKAIAHYRAALILDPNLAIAHLNLALAYRDAGQVPKAIEHAKRGASLAPGNAKARELVQALLRHGK